MTSKTKILQLVFLNEQGKKVTLSLPDPAENLDLADVKQAMTVISQADAFEKEGVEIYRIPQSASYIERVVTNVFDNAAAKSNQLAGTDNN